MLSDEIVSLGSEADLLMQRDTEAESQEDLDPMEVARRQNLALLEEEEAARAALEREMEAENIRKAQQNSVQPQLQPPVQLQPPNKKVRSAGLCLGLSAPAPMSATKPAPAKLRPVSPPGPPETPASNAASILIPSSSGGSRKRNSSGIPRSQPPSQPQADPQTVYETLIASGFSPEDATAAAMGLQGKTQPLASPPAPASSSDPQQQLFVKFMQSQTEANNLMLERGKASNRSYDNGPGLEAYYHREPDMSDPSNSIRGSWEVEDNSTDTYCWPLRLAMYAPNQVI